MIELTDEGFDTLTFARAGKEPVSKEFDLFKLDSEMVNLAEENQTDDAFFGKIAAHLEALLGEGVRVSHQVARKFYKAVRAKVEGIKKNDPSLTSAGNPSSTVSPSGPTTPADDLP